MKTPNRILIPFVTFIVGLPVSVVLFGEIVHEESHAIACMLFNVPFRMFISHVNTIPLTGVPKIVVGLAGGIGEALISLLFFWSATIFEKKNSNWFLGAIGFEIAFLAMAFMGFINSIWEGLFNDSYQVILNNPTILLTLLILTILFSFLVVKGLKFKKLQDMLAIESSNKIDHQIAS
jgi:hypothetical protein